MSLVGQARKPQPAKTYAELLPALVLLGHKHDQLVKYIEAHGRFELVHRLDAIGCSPDPLARARQADVPEPLVLAHLVVRALLRLSRAGAVPDSWISLQRSLWTRIDRRPLPLTLRALHTRCLRWTRVARTSNEQLCIRLDHALGPARLHAVRFYHAFAVGGALEVRLLKGTRRTPIAVWRCTGAQYLELPLCVRPTDDLQCFLLEFKAKVVPAFADLVWVERQEPSCGPFEKPRNLCQVWTTRDGGVVTDRIGSLAALGVTLPLEARVPSISRMLTLTQLCVNVLRHAGLLDTSARSIPNQPHSTLVDADFFGRVPGRARTEKNWLWS